MSHPDTHMEMSKGEDAPGLAEDVDILKGRRCDARIAPHLPPLSKILELLFVFVLAIWARLVHRTVAQPRP